jgi:glycosyltransferase involved in cell wall biosynthesis
MSRICFISDHASPLAALGGVDAGGQNVYVDQVARALGSMGHHVDVYTRRDRPDLPKVVRHGPGVRVIHVDAGPPEPVPKEALLPWMGEFADAVVEAACADPYDVAHAHFFLSGLVADRLLRETGTPYAITFHALGRVRRREQGPNDGFPDARFAIEDRVVRSAEAIVAECPQDRDDLVELYGADPRRITIVPCGVDPRELTPGSTAAARARLNLPSDLPIVLQLGRLVPRKGVDDVIRAMGCLVSEEGIRARLLVVGGATRVPDPDADPELRRLMSVAEASGVSDLVTFVGSRRRDELADYYRAADVFVSTPWYEPFGITPLESMACGTPVIGSAVGGIKWTVVDGRTGLLVPPRDPKQIGEALADLLSDSEKRAAMGVEGVRRIHEGFTWRQVSQAIGRLYQRMRARHPQAGGRRVSWTGPRLGRDLRRADRPLPVRWGT